MNNGITLVAEDVIQGFTQEPTQSFIVIGETEDHVVNLPTLTDTAVNNLRFKEGLFFIEETGKDILQFRQSAKIKLLRGTFRKTSLPHYMNTVVDSIVKFLKQTRHGVLTIESDQVNVDNLSFGDLDINFAYDANRANHATITIANKLGSFMVIFKDIEMLSATFNDIGVLNIGDETGTRIELLTVSLVDD